MRCECPERPQCENDADKQVRSADGTTIALCAECLPDHDLVDGDQVLNIGIMVRR